MTASPPAPAGPEDVPPPEAEAPAPRSSRRRTLLLRLLGMTALGGVVAASWFALPIRAVQVSGQKHLSVGEVKALAGLTTGFGWLYYGGWRARGLLGSPWVDRASVRRVFPDRIELTVTERVPVARWQPPGGDTVAVASDGTVLPGARGADSLPLVSGWGPERLPEALGTLAALAKYNVQSVAYTPAGIRVKLPDSSVWTGNTRYLLKYAGSIRMYPNKTIHIYPWGVSVQE